MAQENIQNRRPKGYRLVKRDTLLRQQEETQALQQTLSNRERKVAELEETLAGREQALREQAEQSATDKAKSHAELAQSQAQVAELLEQIGAFSDQKNSTEERIHFANARALDLQMPPIDVESAHKDAKAKLVRHLHSMLSESLAGGTLALVGERPNEWTENLPLIPPTQLQKALQPNIARLVAVDDHGGHAMAEALRESLGKAELSVLPISDFLLQQWLDPSGAARVPLTQPYQPLAARPVLVISDDHEAQQQVTQAVHTLSNVNFVTLVHSKGRLLVEQGVIARDQWLAFVFEGWKKNARLGFHISADDFAWLAQATQENESPLARWLLQSADILWLTWSNHQLFTVYDLFRRIGGKKTDFDKGDARIELPEYQRIVRNALRVQATLSELEGSDKRIIQKLYCEGLESADIAHFCRLAQLPVQETAIESLRSALKPPVISDDMADAANLLREVTEQALADDHFLNPSYSCPYFQLGRSLESLGRYSEALPAYLAALEEFPLHELALEKAIYFLEAMGDLKSAERLLRKMLKASQDKISVLNRLAAFYYKHRRYRSTLAAYRLMQRYGSSATPSKLAMVYAYLGDYPRAAPHIAVAGKKTNVPQFIQDIADLPGLAEALPAVQRQAKTSTEAQVHFNLGESLRRLGQLDAALPAYRRAFALNPRALEEFLGRDASLFPQFLLVGPPRTGTTLLRSLFKLHPEIAIPSGEPGFFYQNAPAPLQDYMKFFTSLPEGTPAARLIGEKSPHYFNIADPFIELLSLFFPQLKIIVTVREPIARAWSEIKNDDHAVIANIAAALAKDTLPAWMETVIDRGRYGKQLARWSQYFSPSQILLVDAEKLETEIAAEANRLFAWLGVAPLKPEMLTSFQKNWDNRTPDYAPSAALNELLAKTYAEERWRVSDLQKILGKAIPRAAPAKKIA